jgi:CRISPR-associated protein (TIGR03986 family)
MSEVHTPYHFVPLSKWIYMPDWAHLVSHDVPFKYGISGVLEYTLTNATPLCVGGEQEQAGGGCSVVKWAKDPMGNPVIPGSSLKGMVRNVLEIASFGKFSGIDESHFSYRDVSSNSQYLQKVTKNNTVKSAWLKFDNDTKNWTLTSCNFAKIKHSEIKKSLSKNIKNSDTAIQKYTKIGLNKPITVTTFKKVGKQGTVVWAKDINQGHEKAHLVFCNNRIKGQGKPEDYEFSYCFYGEGKGLSVEASTINDKANKLFASHDEQHIKFLRENPSEKGIPVFALFEKGTNKLHSLGLAKMPRVLYQHSATNLADNRQTKARMSEHYFDMSELMFGCIREKGFSLKSRVMFSDSVTEINKGLYNSNFVTLNGPKATFKEAYLEQSNPNKYSDYDDKNAQLSGWKRYVTQSAFKENPSSNDNLKVKSQLELMKENSRFTGKVVFHNLKREELGALLWSLTLGNNEENKEQYHGLGHGKSLGAGVVQLTVKNLILNANDTGSNTEELTANKTNYWITQFIKHMNQQHSQNSSGWEESVQIKNLLAMTNMEENKDRDLTYMELDDFKNVRNKASLPVLKLKGEELSRTDSKLAEGSLSFAKGRLAALCVEEDKADTWFKEELNKQVKLSQAIKERQEMETAAAAEEKIKEQMENMPEDLKKVTQLSIELNKTTDINAKRALSASVDRCIDDLLVQEASKQSAQLLYDTVRDKKVCEYLNISNKKKLKPRKDKMNQLAEKYTLQVST